MTKTEISDKSDKKALKIVLFVIVVFACIAATLVGVLAGWGAGTITLLLLMLPAATIYRSSGIKGSGSKR